MTAEQLWSKFAEKNGIKHNEYEAWQFGGAPDKLAELVLRGIKTGTASAEELYKIDNEPIPTEGEYSVILNSRDEAVCVIRTTKVYIVPFCDVSAHHAFCEGEGDRSLAYCARFTRISSGTNMLPADLNFLRTFPLFARSLSCL